MGELILRNKNQIREEMNYYGKSKKPFYFLTDFSLERNILIPAEQLSQFPIHFAFQSESNFSGKNIYFKKKPVSRQRYYKAFQTVKSELQKGNSFLVNLTFPSTIQTDLSLDDIFHHSRAKYKLFWEDRLVVFSPETFIQVKNGVISTFPMKGTISAKLPGARNILLNDLKESAEHATIVDLLRNDMSQFASGVHVHRYKYLEKINTNEGDIWQMSSEIRGDISACFPHQLGDILISMLPAGSVSGAPKEQTLKIIEKTENYDRGYYCGVAGFFDGNSLDSFVMIRYVEKTESGLIFKSGGGIHQLSELDNEYNELIDKIYVPIH